VSSPLATATSRWLALPLAEERMADLLPVITCLQHDAAGRQCASASPASTATRAFVLAVPSRYGSRRETQIGLRAGGRHCPVGGLRGRERPARAP
jgi:hypothetical protein